MFSAGVPYYRLDGLQSSLFMVRFLCGADLTGISRGRKVWKATDLTGDEKV